MIEVKNPGIDLTVDDCITILENIKERGKFYDETLPCADQEDVKTYCEHLAGLEALAIDKVIELLKNRV